MTPAEMRQDAIVPEIGIHYDVPFDEYLAWDAISNSKISAAHRSLLHLNELEPIEPKPPMRFGKFMHTGLLEPLAVGERYAVMPPYELDPENVRADGSPSQSKSTNYYDAKRDNFLAENEGKEIVSRGEYQRLMAIARRLKTNLRAKMYVNGADTEVSLVWIDERTELLCKARLDAVVAGWITDLKSTEDVRYFSHAIARYGYHRQAAHYQEGWRVLTGDVWQYALVAIEPKAPHAISAAPLSKSAIRTGQTEVQEALAAIKMAKQSGVWPGPDEPETWDLPDNYKDEDMGIVWDEEEQPV